MCPNIPFICCIVSIHIYIYFILYRIIASCWSFNCSGNCACILHVLCSPFYYRANEHIFWRLCITSLNSVRLHSCPVKREAISSAGLCWLGGKIAANFTCSPIQFGFWALGFLKLRVLRVHCVAASFVACNVICV